ncbi:SDR family NAD(P)-dependent oxidoreductase [Frondihabitans cladoniiphilus]|uniref:SDR family oxidoreductase n=1 Tax=Frondihabitans cladoniiphilus TaxID=715785 RepID=A0ABP8VPE1_9MICO
MDLTGKKIIVTGGAQGIGAATVRGYAEAGATVTAVDLNEEGGNKTAADATAKGPGTVTFRKLDVSDRKAVDDVFAAAAEEMGGLDVMVNVAGIQRFAEADEPDMSFVELIYRINVFGTMNTDGAAYKIMKAAGGGAIINFGSEAGFTAELHNAVYGSTKGAVHTWTRSIAREWGPDNIRVNAVMPYMTTPMYEKFRADMTPEDLAAHDLQTAKDIPLGGKFGDPDKDIAPVMVFLASDASHFITGQLIPVDGGLVNVR